jgi:hypothetical protein
MKKIIYQKKSLVEYTGKKNELDEQIKNLVSSNPLFYYMVEHEEDLLQLLSRTKLQTMYECLSYKNNIIWYGPNGSPNPINRLTVKKCSERADKKFLEDGKNNLEIIIEDKQ